MDRVTTLLADMAMVRPYPAGTAAEIAPKAGRGFFPGRMGVVGRGGLPRRPVMVVGQDFDELTSWEGTPDGDETGATWDELPRVLGISSRRDLRYGSESRLRQSGQDGGSDAIAIGWIQDAVMVSE